jgi:hypothetical protein
VVARIRDGERRPREPAMAAAMEVREWWGFAGEGILGKGGAEAEEGAMRWGIFTSSPSGGVLLLHRSGEEYNLYSVYEIG